MAIGTFTFVLHSHLPWVLHHGRWPHGVDWLNEAAAETYLPLWRTFHERTEAGARSEPQTGSLGVTIGLSPVLCEQLAHPDFHRELVAYLEQKIAAATLDRDALEKEGDAHLASLASRWEAFYRATLEDFLGPHGPNIVRRFRRLEESGAVEIITCGATHGYFPLLASDAAVDRQVRVAVATHRRHFGRAPRGIWLPECAYRPAGPWHSPVDPAAPPVQRRGVEDLLAAHGLEYFFVDRHLLSGGQPLGVYADRFDAVRHLVRDAGGTAPASEHLPYRPYRVGVAGQASCFGRDPSTALQVWSGETGYPGDGAYLDFHKKRFPGGHRYWAVTHPKADLGDKRPYLPEAAASRIPEHARHFTETVADVLAEAAKRQNAPPVLCAMFDTELFGHWWFEGPQFVAEVIDRAAAAGIELSSAGTYLHRHPAREKVDLPEGSWGDGGHHAVWLNEQTRWTWTLVHGAEARWEGLTRAAQGRPAEPLLDRLLAQTGRELLLLESSDWQFLITTVAARDYAERRLSEHAADFGRLAELAERRLEGGSLSQGDEAYLAACEMRDGLFADFDPRAALPENVPAGR